MVNFNPLNLYFVFDIIIFRLLIVDNEFES